MEYTTERKGFFESIVLSFKDPKSLKHFKNQKILSSISFLLLLIFIYVLVEVSIFTFSANRFLNEITSFYDRNLPEIRIINGKAQVKGKMPIIVGVEKSVIIIDTTGKIKDLRKYKSGILLKESEVIVKKNRYDTRRYNLSDVKRFILNKEKILEWKRKIMIYLFPILLIFLLGYNAIAYAIKILVIAAILQSMAKQRDIVLDFTEAANFVIYTITPCIVIFIVLRVIGVSKFIPGIFMVVGFYGLLYFFIMRGLEAMKEDKKEAEAPLGTG